MNYFPTGVRIDYDIADAIFVAVLRDVIQNVEQHGDEPEYDKKITDACRLILTHFGKSQ